MNDEENYTTINKSQPNDLLCELSTLQNIMWHYCQVSARLAGFVLCNWVLQLDSGGAAAGSVWLEGLWKAGAICLAYWLSACVSLLAASQLNTTRC